jgi:hypothetical protein
VGSPWDEERDFLQWALEEPNLVKVTADTRTQVETRLAVLNSAEGDAMRGLVDNLFLPRFLDGNFSMEAAIPPLRLRQGFVFWSFAYDPSVVTQADVYLSIVAILHALRIGEVQDVALTQHEHVRTVIAPGTFSRFNDGVVQAALLRGATKSELDYSHDELRSAQMREILQFIFSNSQSDAGEAVPEFLLALAQGKLQLTRRDATELQKFLQGGPTLPSFLQLLVHSWERRT